MLVTLHIENIAVIESVDLRFDEGFHVLTGETGAGKSIIIDSINALLGERVSRDLLRTSAKKAVVAARFERLSDAPARFLREYGGGREADVSREMTADGRNICRINDRVVPIAVLRELGSLLVDIHGQHDSRHLLDPERHISYLDSYAETGAELAAYRAAYAEMKAWEKKKNELTIDENEKNRRLEMLDYQIAEIERASLRPGEDAKLKEQRDFIAGAGKMKEALDEAHACLYGTEEKEGACALLAEALRALGGAAQSAKRLAELYKRLEELRFSADDIASELRSIGESLSFGEEDLDRIESRLDVLYRLKRKYGQSADEILAYLEKIKKERDEVEYAGEALERAEAGCRSAREKALRLAGALSVRRREGAERLSRALEKELAYLDMARVRFSVEFDAREDDALYPDGADRLEFFLAANAGESLKPLSKTASGGELSRVMLALKNVLAKSDGVSLLIFDEVDTGISGRAAQRVGEKLWTATADGGKQVLCVTHLSQIAALADVHYYIEKKEKAGRTVTTVTRLDSEGRRRELARINMGDAATELSLVSAGEQLDKAAEYKKTKGKE